MLIAFLCQIAFTVFPGKLALFIVFPGWLDKRFIIFLAFWREKWTFGGKVLPSVTVYLVRDNWGDGNLTSIFYEAKKKADFSWGGGVCSLNRLKDAVCN